VIVDILHACEMHAHMFWHKVCVHVIYGATKDSSNVFLCVFVNAKVCRNVSYIFLECDEFCVNVKCELFNVVIQRVFVRRVSYVERPYVYGVAHGWCDGRDEHLRVCREVVGFFP